jgi:hypothetical protein
MLSEGGRRQTEFRQRPNYGMQFNVNYTMAHSLRAGDAQTSGGEALSTPLYSNTLMPT